MGNNLRVRHSYACGDLISILPGLQKNYKETGQKSVIMQRLGLKSHYYDNAIYSTRDEGGEPVCMNQKLWDMMVPLLEYQEYIDHCEIWEGQQFDMDLDRSRDRRIIPLPAGDIYHWPWFIYPELACDLSNDWLTTPDFGQSSKLILISRTERYNNPYITYYFLNEYKEQLAFIGTEKEHQEFCTRWAFNIPHLVVKNFLELAYFIKLCPFMIGNQSLPFHLANAMHVPRLLEYCSPFPNTHAIGAKGFEFLYQEHLEYYFKQLINK